MIKKILTPVQEFMRTEAASGVILGIAAVIAIAAANSPLREAYEHLLHLPIRFGIGENEIEKGLSHWINDGLMVIFFLLVGLEIKRELISGELSSLRTAMLPIVSAAGGAIVPAPIYTALCHGTEMQRGWGIPMATDIAFAVGVLTLLGSRVPAWAKIFLMALAVVDDLIAVLVIALFYTDKLNVTALVWAGVIVALLIALNVTNVRWLPAYLGLGVFLWIAVLGSGVHATIAGVVLALTIPAAKGTRETDAAADGVVELLEEEPQADSELAQARLAEAERLIEDVSPLHRLEHMLHPFVAFGVMPLFAFANAGVEIDPSVLGATITSKLTLGVALGLFFGKQIGIVGAYFILAKAGLTAIPFNRKTLRYVHGLSLVAGIGFTMSLFVGGLSFGAGPHFEEAKLAILATSLVAGVAGYAVLRSMPETART